MNSSTGTIIRGFFVMSLLIIFWYSLASCIYYSVTLFFNFELDFKINIITSKRQVIYIIIIH